MSLYSIRVNLLTKHALYIFEYYHVSRCEDNLQGAIHALVDSIPAAALLMLAADLSLR